MSLKSSSKTKVHMPRFKNTTNLGFNARVRTLPSTRRTQIEEIKKRDKKGRDKKDETKKRVRKIKSKTMTERRNKKETIAPKFRTTIFADQNKPKEHVVPPRTNGSFFLPTVGMKIESESRCRMNKGRGIYSKKGIKTDKYKRTYDKAISKQQRKEIKKDLHQILDKNERKYGDTEQRLYARSLSVPTRLEHTVKRTWVDTKHITLPDSRSALYSKGEFKTTNMHKETIGSEYKKRENRVRKANIERKRQSNIRIVENIQLRDQKEKEFQEKSMRQRLARMKRYENTDRNYTKKIF